MIPRAERNGIVDHGHSLWYMLTTLTPALPLYALLIISVLNLLIFGLDRTFQKLNYFERMQGLIAFLRFKP